MKMVETFEVEVAERGLECSEWVEKKQEMKVLLEEVAQEQEEELLAASNN